VFYFARAKHHRLTVSTEPERATMIMIIVGLQFISMHCQHSLPGHHVANNNGTVMVCGFSRRRSHFRVVTLGKSSTRSWCAFDFVSRFLFISLYTQGEVTSQSLWSRYDRYFVGITRYNALS